MLSRRSMGKVAREMVTASSQIRRIPVDDLVDGQHKTNGLNCGLNHGLNCGLSAHSSPSWAATNCACSTGSSCCPSRFLVATSAFRQKAVVMLALPCSTGPSTVGKEIHGHETHPPSDLWVRERYCDADNNTSASG